MGKKIYIHGSFMNDNFGDYLLFHIINSTLTDDKYDLTLLYSNVDKSYRKYDKYTDINIFKAIKEADMVILAGGGYLGEPNSKKWYWSLRFLLEHALPLMYMIKRKIPYLIVGTGVGPVSYGLPRIIVKKIIKNAQFISVRDVESKMYIRNWGIKKDVKVIPDWVMAYNVGELSTIKNEIIKSIIKKREQGYKVIFVHITTVSHGESNRCILYCLNKLASEQDKVLFVVSPDQGNKKQFQRAKKNAEWLPEEKTFLFTYDNPWVLSSLLNYMDIVITDKLHVGIVATRLYKQVISVPAHSKTQRFYRQIGRDDFCVPLDIINEKMFMSILGKALNSTTNKEEVNKIVEEAKENKEIVKDFVGIYKK